ncbi:MAG TPA: TldD/PmbA family protein [Methanofastidiosum sp.]|nr:TldD/PmbA family protein [Methanofastidiosum sp.]HQF89712.1 TldD/PmbA family protein [Methanofastidiosum sp.]HQG61588.1 TldD/PmbA family protein [Methanofastidiosum sp.]HQK85551.1 TldD/PmbA family protein [Methanofastidiosum sp.]
MDIFESFNFDNLKFPNCFVDIRLQKRANNIANVENGVLEEVSSNEQAGVGVRALINGAWGFSSTNDTDAVQRCIDSAYRIALATSRNSNRDHFEIDPPSIKGKFENKVKINPEDIPLEEKITYAFEIEKGAKIDPLVRNTNSVCTDSITEQLYISSAGSELYQKTTRVYLKSVVASGNDTLQMGYDLIGGTRGYEVLKEKSLNDLGKEACNKSIRLLSAKKVKGGEMTVVLDPKILGVFIHEALGHACEADIVLQGDSILEGKIGEKIGADGVYIYDDPTYQEKNGSYFFDDEGIKAKKTCLLEDGILKSYLHNLETASRFKSTPTGNGRAQGFSSRPLVRMSNVYMGKGDHTFEELIDIKEGLYVKGGRGGQVDTAKGLFTFGCEEVYEIKDGEIGELYRDASLSGNTLEILKNISGIGRDFLIGNPGSCGKGQYVPVDDGGPHIRTRALVGGE